MSVLSEAARPWGPFAVGFAIGVGFVGYLLADALYLRPPALPHLWEYDGVVETYVARYRHYNWRHSVLVGLPFVCGAVTWILWFVLSLAAGGGGA